MKTLAAVLFITTACLNFTACSKPAEEPPPGKSTDIAGACDCVVACARASAVGDPSKVLQCQPQCEKDFETGTVIQALPRAMEVMTNARTGCQ